MKKADVINEISERTGIGRKETGMIVEGFMECVKFSLAKKKEDVFLRGFGSFVRRKRAAKTARNITKNTAIVIPAHEVPVFKPSRNFLEMMK